MARNKSTRWTEDQKAELLKLNAAGDPPRLIAAKLQRSERSVSVRLAQLRKSPRQNGRHL
ncbi:hypothetical protein [Bradyrhizobium sp. CCGUVB23]|uniref:hypothetical protein n=1 Tax=Bradyrhizobium sp. CCGUVB23 TaxID=2949630 RepID=UPI0020B3D0A8|nr:hypothetical protein [Bradyrhizobium sp. CCGUVB23]MCP3460097.1 hypothetical protein [Bradyrhizobium sp. CCGUVB23]